MRAPALALGWEFRRRHLWALIAMAGYLLALAAIKLLFLGPMEPIRLDPPDGRGAVGMTPLTATYFYLLAAFSFGLAGDLGARPSIYPARMFALPVRTAAMVGWPMLYGTAAAPRVRHRLLRRWPGAPRRGARLAGNVRPAFEQRRADRPAGPFSFARPGSSVVRVAAAWPVAAGARGSPAAVRSSVALARQGRAGIRLRNTVSHTDHAAVHGRLPGMDRNPAESPGARFLRRAALHRDAPLDQRRAHRRQAEDGDVEHAGRVAAGARRDAARARVVGHLVHGDGTGAAHE